MMSKFRMKKGSSERGVVGVEFAMLLPIMVVILFGVVEFGNAYFRQQIITSAVREAARKGIVATVPRPSTGDIKTAAREHITAAGLDGNTASVSVGGAGGPSGTPLTVTVDYPSEFPVLSKMVHGFGSDGTIQLTATIQMEIE